MQNAPRIGSAFARTLRASSGFAGHGTLRRGALLIGSCLLTLPAAPAFGQACGPVPPGGGTVTCPAGEYPNGIVYVTSADLEVVLQPGVVAATVRIVALGTADIAVVGPVNTLVTGTGRDALRLSGSQTVVANVDDLSTTGNLADGADIEGANAATLIADTIVTTGNSSYGVRLRETSVGGINPVGPVAGAYVRVNSVTTSGRGSVGVETVAIFGDVRTEVGSVATSGDDSAGIYSISGIFSPTMWIKAGTVTTQGFRSDGIRTFARFLTLESGTVSTVGAESPGIFASATRDVTITSGSVSTRGARSPGMDIRSDRGDTVITSDTVSTLGGFSPGILVRHDLGNVAVHSTSVQTDGPESEGISVRTMAGDLEIVSDSVQTSGSLSTAIHATVEGQGDIVVSSGRIRTENNYSSGIRADAVSGAVTVTSGSISTLGDSATGVVTFVSGPGATSIRTGSITTQGFDSYGVIATSTGTGAIDVVGDETIVTTGVSSPGISAESGGQVTVSANNISTTGANSDAIAVKGSTSTVTIRGVVHSSQDFAVRGEGGARQRSEPGGPVTVNILGSGTLRGRVSLTGGADRIANSGTFDAIGTSLFGAGADVFDNNAGAMLRAVNGPATFAGLETFNNRGTIEMRDGSAGDSLSLPGAYHGTGAALLGLDVDFTAGTADRLITGAATGSSQIAIQGTAGGFTSGILLVDAGAGTSPTAFSLAGGVDTPYFSRNLRFDAANNDFLLVTLPGDAVFETARFGGMATQLWQESADAVAAQLDTVRDGRRGRGIGLWLQGWSGQRERPGTQTLADAGTFDVSYEQDFQGLQGGLDVAAGPARFGITGGAGRSDARFAATGNPVDMNVRNVGLYAQLGAGPFFFNALAKRDWAELGIDSGAGLDAEFDADLFGVQANAGLRLGGGAFFAEPSVGLSWVQADLDSFESGPATVEPGEAESLRARAGLRVGASVPLGGGVLLPFVAANLYEELGSRTESDFTLGETMRLFDEPAGSRAEAAAGLSFAIGSFEAFVRGEMDFGGGSDARAVRAGARLRF